MTRARRRASTALAVAALALTAACTGADGGSRPVAGPSAPAPGERIEVLMVDDPQMVDLETLTVDGFTAETGIEVDFTLLPPDELRAEVAAQLSGDGSRYDVVSLTDHEVPIYAENGWLAPLDEVVDDPAFDRDDIFPSILQGLTGRDGAVYGVPFYGESSFLMYRTDVFEDLGLTMPDRPTWQEVAELARRVDQGAPRLAGICLRGEPGWNELVAPLTTVVNTFGGTWFEQDWTPRLDGPGFRQATDFYVDLLRDHGPIDAAEMGFDECLVAMQQGEVGIWYDATSAAGSLESMESSVKGDVGYVQAPVVQTESSGWLHSWAWGLPRTVTASADGPTPSPQTSGPQTPEPQTPEPQTPEPQTGAASGTPDADAPGTVDAAAADADAAAQFVRWASSREYEELVGDELGWPSVPAGKRQSTYRNEEYLADAAAFALPTVEAIQAADPRNPGLQPRPTDSIQFVEIPEFDELGLAVSRDISAAIARRTTVEAALARGQELAEQVSRQYRQPS